jgi:hypothetical protein
MKEIKAGLVKFCKNTKISDKPLSLLWIKFDQSIIGNPFSRADFELAMLDMNKKPALDLKQRCLDYMSVEGAYNYEKFLREKEEVTREFWNRVATTCIPTKVESVKVVPVREENPEEQYKKLLPLNWLKMPTTERIDFVQKVKHQGFHDYILGIDKSLKAYFAQVSAPKKERLKLYVTLFSVPADPLSEESKVLLRSFVDSLNMLGRANLQFVECTNPSMIEVREVR